MPIVHRKKQEENESREVVDARLLGQILAAQNFLFVLPNSARIAEFYAESFRTIPGVTACRVCMPGVFRQSGEFIHENCRNCALVTSPSDLDTVSSVKNPCRLSGCAGIVDIPLAANDHFFGYFLLSIHSPKLFEGYKPFLLNLANYVALTLETRLQKRELQRSHDELEQHVADRTRELRETNTLLEHDIRQRKQIEEKLQTINRLYAVISQINQMIIRARDESDVFRLACSIVVQYGQFQMAWIGLLDKETGRVRPVFWAGEEEGYLTLAEITSSRQDDPRANGPTGTCIRENRCVFCNDIANDPAMSPWKEAALARRYRSSIALPIHRFGAVIGSFSLYASIPGYFNTEEIKLLTEVTEDISFAVETIENEKKRKGAEFALRESEEKFRSLYENSLHAVLLTAPDGIVLSANPFACRLFGMTEQELCRTGRTGIVDETDPRLPAALQERAEKGIFNGELRFRRRNGTMFTGEVSSILFPSKEGETRASVVIRDITQRKKNEEDIRILSRAIEQSSACIVITNVKGIIEYVNPTFTTVTGFSPGEAVGKTPNILKSGKTAKSIYEEMWKTITAGGEWRGELVNKRKNGGLYWASISIAPVKNEQGVITHFLAVQEDVTERKELVEQFHQAQKVESLGTLASGIAHDFNNLLGIILAYAGVLERSGTNPEVFAQGVLSIKKAVERGANLVRQILTFARKTESAFSPTDINALVREIESMLRETFPRTIEIAVQTEEKLPFIDADRTKIHQVLMNLSVNARDAMPKGGTLSFRTRQIAGKDLPQNFSEPYAHHFVAVDVMDTGTGMDEATMARIFDPFFTTKELGKGTGLGLSMANGVMKLHKGFINVHSEPGKGTTFTLYFPLAGEKAEPIHCQESLSAPVRGGTETILVVEDEDPLRELVVGFLQSEGYTVIEAQDGKEAVSLYKEKAGSIDIVITDMGLPKLSGLDEIMQIRSVNPQAKVIITSGFIDPETRSELNNCGVTTIVQKPYSRIDILCTLRSVLDAQPQFSPGK